MKTDAPIDAVVLWVDGSDRDWQRERANHWQRHCNQCDASNADHRFANCDELVYCLRSIYVNAPWIRTIYLVTCGQQPKWLDVNHPKIKLVNHRDIMNRGDLPTFNSCAIEMHLHKIPGLSECFLYMNDDCFITRKTTRRHFFHNNGKAYFNSHRLMQNPPNCNEINSFNYTIRNNQECLDKLFGRKTRYRPDHQGYLVYKSACQYIERNAPEYFKSTQQQRFRVDSTRGEKTLNAYIFATAGLELGMYELRLNADEQYYTIQQAREQYATILTKTPMLLCINNAHTESDQLFVHQLMSTLLPKPAVWELPNMIPKYSALKIRPKSQFVGSAASGWSSSHLNRASKTAVNRFINQASLLSQLRTVKTNREVVYQVKPATQNAVANAKVTKTDLPEGKHSKKPIHLVEFYLPPKYLSTQVNKTRTLPTTNRHNRKRLYNNLEKYRDSRLMNIAS